METSNPAQIYLATQRGLSETPDRRIFHSLHDPSGRGPIRSLLALNEVSLRAGATWTLAARSSFVLLLPIVGGLGIGAALETHFLEPGQAGFFHPTEDRDLIVRNPYETESISLLHLELAALLQIDPGAYTVSQFDLRQANTLHLFLDLAPVQGYLGRFDGRQEGSYAIQNTDTVVFVYVLQGVFEVANRLLDPGDALSLHYQQPSKLEFEALSNHAILLLLHLGSI